MDGSSSYVHSTNGCARHARRIAVGLLGVAAALCMLFAAPASADAQQLGLRIGGGTSSPVGTFADEDAADARLGAHFMAALELGGPLIPLRARADVGLFNFCTPLCPEGGLEATYRVGIGGAALVVPLRNPSPLEPYLLAGGGLYRFWITGEDSGLLGEESSTDPGLNGGVGLDLRLGGIGVFAEGRYHAVLRSDADNLTFIPVTLGLRFGGR